MNAQVRSTMVSKIHSSVRALASGAALALGLWMAAGCGGEPPGDGDAASADSVSGDAGAPPAADACSELAALSPDSMTARESGLRVLERAEGEGREASPGDTVRVHYLGCLTSGEKFDASYDRNQPFSFRLGDGRVIEGWERGVRGMRPGAVRVLRIPPDLGYGERGTPGGPIPPNATLLFRVELLDVRPGSTGSG